MIPVERLQCLPAVNLIEHIFPSSVAIFADEVLSNPCDEMILEGTFDELMEEVAGHHLVYIGSREVIREWL